MKYRIRHITEADFGCEERQEGEPLLCGLALEILEVQGSEAEARNETEDGNEAKERNEGEEGKEDAGDRSLYREIPDALAWDLGLAEGQILTDAELDALIRGEKPEGWGDLNHRQYYQTDIGPVCMSADEYRIYRQKKRS